MLKIILETWCNEEEPVAICKVKANATNIAHKKYIKHWRFLRKEIIDTKELVQHFRAKRKYKDW